MMDDILDTYHANGQVWTLRVVEYPHLMPTLQPDGAWEPGPHAAYGAVPKRVGREDWDGRCWLYFVQVEPKFRILRPLTDVEAAAQGVYSFGRWVVKAEGGTTTVACGHAVVAVRRGYRSTIEGGKYNDRPTIAASGQARFEVSTEAKVLASEDAIVFLRGTEEEPIEAHGRGHAILHGLTPYVEMSGSEDARLRMVLKPLAPSAPRSAAQEEDGPDAEAPAAQRVSQLVAEIVESKGWAFDDLNVVRNSFQDHGGPLPLPTRHRAGLEAACLPALPPGPDPSLLDLMELRGVTLLRALREVVDNPPPEAPNLDALTPWLTSLVTGNKNIEAAVMAATCLCRRAKQGAVGARQVVLGLLTQAVNPKVLGVILTEMIVDGDPEVVDRVGAMELHVHMSEVVALAVRYVPKMDQQVAVDFILRAAARSPHRSCVLEPLISGVFLAGIEAQNLLRLPELRPVVFQAVAECKILLVEKLLILLYGPLSEGEREIVARRLPHCTYPTTLARLARLAVGADSSGMVVRADPNA